MRLWFCSFVWLSQLKMLMLSNAAAADYNLLVFWPLRQLNWERLLTTLFWIGKASKPACRMPIWQEQAAEKLLWEHEKWLQPHLRANYRGCIHFSLSARRECVHTVSIHSPKAILHNRKQKTDSEPGETQQSKLEQVRSRCWKFAECTNYTKHTVRFKNVCSSETKLLPASMRCSTTVAQRISEVQLFLHRSRFICSTQLSICKVHYFTEQSLFQHQSLNNIWELRFKISMGEMQQDFLETKNNVSHSNTLPWNYKRS